MAVPISNVTRRVVYAASGTGPYAFTFEILANTDIAVYKDDTLLTLTTDYTVTIASNGTGSITLVASPTGATQIAIVGNRTIQRTTDFVTGGDFFANTVNDEMDQQTIFAQQNAEGLQRALQAPQTDPTTINMVLPRATLRANKVLSFDSTGNPNATEFIGSNRGNWTSGTLYYVRDIVKDTSNNNIYQCSTQHTASGSQPISTNADSGKWALLVDAASAAAAQAAAEAAQAAAETAQAAAETAEANAETAETNAETAATAASSSASAASTSASNASSSASTASTAATNAGNSATAAATSATSASNSASAASTSASNASSSASAASTSASNASTSATNAASSATAASGSASTASTHATNAASSASAAATSATNASNSASAAASSASDASTSASAAAASFDSFDDRYLGAKSSAPSVDNDGNALLTGAIYWNTSVSTLYIWTGSVWTQAAFTASGFATLTGAETLTNKTLTSPVLTGSVAVPTPSAGTDAANKSYVDGVAQGLSVKESVQLATAAALPTNTYNNGSSGVGATLTGVATGVLTVDGVTVALNDRVLVKNETNSANNGIYLCTIAGAVGVAYVLTRAVNMNEPTEIAGAFTFVENGSVNDASGFVVADAGPYTIGTTAIVWTKFSSVATTPAGSTGQVQYNNAGAFGAISSGTSGQVLTSGGSGAAPTWSTPSAGAMTLLSVVTASNSATIDIETTFNSTYDNYVLYITDLVPVAAGAGILARLKISGAYVTGLNYYYQLNRSGNSSTTYLVSNGMSTDSVYLANNSQISQFILSIFSPSNTTKRKMFNWQGVSITDGSAYTIQASGVASMDLTGAMTGIRIYTDSGNISSGTFRLYGIQKS